MNDSLPTVSIILPCRNEKDHIEACVRSILVQEQPPGGFEIIISDGLSEDGTCDILRRMAEEDLRIRIIDNPARIVSAGLNLAISAARGRIIIRIDAHSIYAKDYVRQSVEVLEQTCADNVGGPRHSLGNGYVQEAIAAAYRSVFAAGGARYHNPNFEGYVDTVPYGCWSSETFKRFGLFDEQLVRNQDDEFNLRLIRAGGRIWQSPRIKSWYVPRRSLVDLYRQHRQYGYWKIPILLKYKLPSTARQLVPGSFVLVLIALIPASLWSSTAAWILAGLLGIYVGCSIVASTLTAIFNGWKLLPILPFVFVSFHIGYGLGFLRGVLDFCFLRRRPDQTFTALTRSYRFSRK